MTWTCYMFMSLKMFKFLVSNDFYVQSNILLIISHTHTPHTYVERGNMINFIQYLNRDGKIIHFYIYLHIL